MEMDNFATQVCSELEKELGPNYQVEVKEVRKNNGVLLHGLMVRTEGQDIVPTIYLESFLEAYESGASFISIMHRIIEVYRNDVPSKRINMDFFHSFEAVRDRICYRLIQQKGNEELLAGIPYIEYLDLAICFYYAYQDSGGIGDGSILIHNSHMEMWDTCTAELFGLANRNTRRLFPWECKSLNEVVSEISGNDARLEDMDFLQEMPMKVLTNSKRVQGAACMLYPGVLEELAQREGRGFYILPSSIHDVILLPDTTGAFSTKELKQMIADVNCTQVDPEEVLSDSLYYYDPDQKRVSIIL